MNLTIVAASTTISAKKSECMLMIFELIDVLSADDKRTFNQKHTLAALMMESRLISAVGIVNADRMYLMASLQARVYPAIMELG